MARRRMCPGWGTYGVGQGGIFVAVTCANCDSTRRLKANLQGDVKFPPHCPVYHERRKRGVSRRRRYR